MGPRTIAVYLAAMLLLSACGGSDDNCPGLCPDETVQPTMTISTDDGSASIASAKILTGPCAYLLIRSAGEVGMPTGYAAAQVTYGGPRDVSTACQVELTSRFGQTVVIAAQVTSGAYQQTCCPYGTCCPKASTVTQHYHLEFAPQAQTVSFPRPDGGVGDDAADAAVDAFDAALDGPGQLDLNDANRSGIDLASLDSPSLESPALDGPTVDSPGLESPGFDSATVDSPVAGGS
jgi:hypothetical protein